MVRPRWRAGPRWKPGVQRTDSQGMADRRAHREQLQPDRPESHAGLLPQHSTARSVRFWTGPPPGQSPGPGPVPWSWTGPLGPRPIRRNGKRGSAESRTPRRSAAPERRPAARRRGTQYVPRTPPSGGQDGPVWLARDAGAATASPRGRMRAAGKLRVCARRGRGYASLPQGGHRNAAPPGGDPARPSDQGGRPSHGRQPGSEGLKAGAARAAIYDAARQDDAELSYNQC